MKLYEMGLQYTEISRLLEEAEGADNANATEALTIALDEIDEDMDAKLLSIAKLVESYRAEAAAIKEVAARQAKRAKAAEGHADWLANYALATMKRTGHLKIVSPELTMRLKLGTGSVEVFDEARVPDQFWRTKEIREIDRAGLRDALLAFHKAGTTSDFTVSGARLVFNEKLEIR